MRRASENWLQESNLPGLTIKKKNFEGSVHAVQIYIVSSSSLTQLMFEQATVVGTITARLFAGMSSQQGTVPKMSDIHVSGRIFWWQAGTGLPALLGEVISHEPYCMQCESKL